ncbi:hypothetical protein L226DRAFT_615369 [Lentinus tigrinus ALCF2SS1-7]|uniref:Fe2OG dioxygenase domain-containing protein n=1 Tax=Lentinus tigrinus ALCF2SS1-6 TaxID=1328759 RepID=A0A5C2S000_9APHY|nr:hypothetical protein L227DRAFT_553177 [Lentinus tigrinus ALCF2SS1-6]RPD71612.1 hypothetical protein L226DRAFT_615369 [Lentinus tigrinus ALCF2SS1-7]
MAANAHSAKTASANQPQDDLLEEQLTRIRLSITEGPPYCQGTLSLPNSDFTLFYGKEGNAGRLNLSTATEAQLQQLADACQPATFGLNQQDVHDETYRKAGKLDKTDFLLAFDAIHAGLIDVVGEELVIPRYRMEETIRAEMYKLNVYGPGSFFKPHVDTPRSELQFGSLVIVFPTAHEGGALALREHEGEDENKVTKEWTFDSSALLANCTEPSIAYVAFFSDVEHEVLPVTSGYRVTITYNLYWTDRKTIPPAVSVPKPVPTNEDTLRTTMRALLDDPTFLPDGAVLMYGLHYKYPLDAHESPQNGRNALKNLTTRLKACDAVVLNVAQELGLPAKLGVLYITAEGRWHRSTILVLCDRVAPLSHMQQVEYPLWETLKRDYGGELLTRPLRRFDGKPIANVKWISTAPRFTRKETTFMAYGNEKSMETTYWEIYLRLSVGPAGDRGGKPRDLPASKEK